MPVLSPGDGQDLCFLCVFCAWECVSSWCEQSHQCCTSQKKAKCRQLNFKGGRQFPKEVFVGMIISWLVQTSLCSGFHSGAHPRPGPSGFSQGFLLSLPEHPPLQCCSPGGPAKCWMYLLLAVWSSSDVTFPSVQTKLAETDLIFNSCIVFKHLH